MRIRRSVTAAAVAVVSLLATATATAGSAAAGTVSAVSATGADRSHGSSLTAGQRAYLYGIARDTWRFFADDVDPRTHLPLDNLGPGSTRGEYTSAANIGVYLWSVVSAGDLHLISHARARSLLDATLRTVTRLRRSHGMLFQWYDTTNGAVLLNPGQGDCDPTAPPAQDNCSFLSAVDNGWYASGLVVTRQAFPELRHRVDPLVDQLDFSIFYDNRPQTACNTNASLPGNPPTGQMYGGYYAGQGPAGYHNGALYSDPRIAMYLGLGLHQMPGDVWWRTWRTLPPQRCPTDPDFSTQGQWPPQGYWANVRDPRSGKRFAVWEGHYTYPGTSLRFIPTFNGGMFEALMADDVVPETTWGPHSFGLADRRYAEVQIKYATQQLGYPVWGISPSSTADDTGGYSAFGVQGLLFPASDRLALGPCTASCDAVESTVSPHASFLALDVLPRQAFANIVRLRTQFPATYAHDGGFYDALNPTTGAVGHRRLVLDQSMIMASLDNALDHGRLQRWFARDPVSSAARLYLGAETMSLG